METNRKSHPHLRPRVAATKRSRRPSSTTAAAASQRFREGSSRNTVLYLKRREIGGGDGPRMAGKDRNSSSNVPERFHNFMLQEEFDPYDPKHHMFVTLTGLMKRSQINEIITAKGIIFALAQSGLCAAFNRTTNKHICFMNTRPDEVIRSLFYNKNNDSLVIMSLHVSDHFKYLKCRTIPIEDIRKNQLGAGVALFESESLRWPGFVEFDDVNDKVLTYSSQNGIYKVFDLKNYNLLYSISDENIEEIKLGLGVIVLIYKKVQSHVLLKILSVEDGTELKSFTHMLHRNKNITFIEQFNEKLLVKQENENLQIVDVRNLDSIEVCKTEFMPPSTFMFLYEDNLFLTFRNRTVAVWNIHGELLTSFEHHFLWLAVCDANNAYMTSDQKLIISYCRAGEGDTNEREVSAVGSINISNVLTGKCIAKISPSDPALQISPRRKGDPTRSSVHNTVREALEEVTALFFDEDRNEIYTGSKGGLIHVWSN